MPIDARMGEPRFCGGDLARRRQRAAIAREHAGDGVGGRFHGRRDPAAVDLVRLRKVEKRRQHRPRRDDRRRDQLRNLEQLRPAAGAAACRRPPRRCWWCRDRCRPETRLSGISRGSRLADVQLQLPTVVRRLVSVAPELQRSDLGHPALERHRDDRRRSPLGAASASVTSSGPSSSSSSPQSSIDAPRADRSCESSS